MLVKFPYSPILHYACSLAAFLQGRSQFVKLTMAVSTITSLNGGIPQGTKLDPMLFAIMVNDLLSNWSVRAKCVDDLSVLEIIPRNSPSILNHLVADIQDFADSNNMRLNPIKCKDFSVDFLHYNSCVCQPLWVSKLSASSHSSFSIM